MIPLLQAWVSTSALYLSGLLLPVGGFVLMLFTPQPGLRLERTLGTTALLALIALVSLTAALVGGALPAVFYLTGFALLTLLLPTLLRRGWSIETTVGSVTVALATAVAAAALAFGSGPVGILEALAALLRDSRERILEMYQHAGIAGDRFDELAAATTLLVDAIIRLAPALMLVSVGLTVLLNLLVVRWQQRRAGTVPVFGDLTLWSAPEGLVWMLIVTGYGFVAPVTALPEIALNGFVVIGAVYFLQGIAITQFWFVRWGTPAWLRAVFYVFVVAEWLLAVGVVFLGIFDLWADFRRLKPRPEEDD